ncbi:Replicative DNA helicase [Chitinispirillum alkaliphilum]|nr:Replicative DNA helicase [Chitinispirillum alkaliphilum]
MAAIKSRTEKPKVTDVNLAKRLPPQSIDVEKTILGSMLIDGEAAVQALELLEEECFYSSANRKIFSCMKELFEKNITIDVISVAETLRKKSWFEDVGEEIYLSELVENITTSGNIEYYSEILREKATLRQLITVAAEITTDCFDNEQEPKVILDNAEKLIYDISEAKMASSFQSTGELLSNTFKEIENYTKGGFKGVPTGFKELDDMTTGLGKGDLVIIAGRPAMGKTAFILSLTLNAASLYKHPTAIFSLEMSKAQLVQRMLCSEARVSMHALRSGTLPKRDFPKLSVAAGPLAEAPIFIDDTPSITVLELRAKARRLKAKHGLDLLIVDYLQLMGSSGKQESRQQEISQISRSLKGVAKELDIPVIALSQLSRAVEQRTGNHRPQLSDLRESGAIEQDADIVMFVYRDEVYHPDGEDNKGKAEIIIGKQRNGPIGTANLAFVKDFARFENLSEREEIAGF